MNKQQQSVSLRMNRLPCSPYGRSAWYEPLLLMNNCRCRVRAPVLEVAGAVPGLPRTGERAGAVPRPRSRLNRHCPGRLYLGPARPKSDTFSNQKVYHNVWTWKGRKGTRKGRSQAPQEGEFTPLSQSTCVSFSHRTWRLSPTCLLSSFQPCLAL